MGTCDNRIDRVAIMFLVRLATNLHSRRVHHKLSYSLKLIQRTAKDDHYFIREYEIMSPRRRIR